MQTSTLQLNPVIDLEYFFESTADLFFVAGYDGYFKKVNKAVIKTLGYTEEELFAKPIDEFIYPEDRALTLSKREDVKRNNPLTNFENRYLAKNGEIVWLSWTSVPVASEQHVYAIAKIVTHKKKLEEDRNLLLTNLTQINHNLQQLTYSASHDLRLPVGNLLSVFGLLDISKIEDKETLEFVDILRQSAECLKTTLDNYLDILNQKNVLQVQVEELDINQCLNTALHSLQSLIDDSHTSVSINLSAFSQVKFNDAFLESIFLNLISNSIKYSMAHAAPVIRIKTRIENGVKQLVFEDEGIGFDMDRVKDKIFGLNQRFNTRTDSRGIGLYLVYNHIAGLGGKITVDSQLNKGATFTISFAG